MILVDTSVWIDHLRSGDAALGRLLDDQRVLGHPWVVGELALGNMQNREEILRLLDALPQSVVAEPTEVRALIDRHGIRGLGLGYVDAQLLAATLLTAGATLWSRDKRLSAVAARLGVAWRP